MGTAIIRRLHAYCLISQFSRFLREEAQFSIQGIHLQAQLHIHWQNNFRIAKHLSHDDDIVMIHNNHFVQMDRIPPH